VKLSKLFTKTRKDYPKDEISVSSQLLIRAGYIDKLSAGVYTLLPLGLRVCNRISSIIRSEMEDLGASEVLMPTLIPKENLQQTGRWETFDALYKLKGTNDKDYALGATHEEVVVPLARQFVFSYKDLPFGIYQIQNKFRKEARAKSGVLRTREFLMKDLYSFHLCENCLDEYYDKVQATYWNIFKKCGIKDKTYLTFASGGSFAKYSHEFQMETEAGEDEIYVCKKCRTGLNREILDKEFKCPSCGAIEYDLVKAVEVGNIFKLKDAFSQPFNLKFVDKEDHERIVMMGCYGIGIQRLMGAVAEVGHDEDGLTWPEQIAPYRAYLIGLDDTASEALELYKELTKAGVEVIYDDRDVSAGGKFADCDLMGIPYRIVISKKTDGKFELKKRSSKETEILTKEELFSKLS